MGQQDNVEEKPTVIMYTYIYRHAATPNKNKTKEGEGVVIIVIIYDEIVPSSHTPVGA